MTGRYTVEEYDLMAEKSSAIDEIDAHKIQRDGELSNDGWKEWDEIKSNSAWKKYDKEITLDEAVSNKLDEVISKAKEDITNATVKKNNVSTVKSGAIDAIDELYAFAVEKAYRLDYFDNTWVVSKVNSLKETFSEDDEQEELEEILTTLQTKVDAERGKLVGTTNRADYTKKLSEIQEVLNAYVSLVTAKKEAKDGLEQKYTDLIEYKEGPGKNTEDDFIYLAQLKEALANGKAAVDAATISDPVGNKKGSVEKAKTDAETEMSKIGALNTKARETVKNINTYINTLDTVEPKTIPGDTKLTYKDGIKTTIDSVLSFEAISAVTDEGTNTLEAYEKSAKESLHKALKSYLANLLTQLSNREGSKDADEVMSLATYKKLTGSLETLNTASDYKEADFDSELTLKALVDDFVSDSDDTKMVHLVTLETLKGDMQTAFETEIKWSDGSVFGKAITGTEETSYSSYTKFSELPSVVDVKAKADFTKNNDISSAKDYATIAEQAKTDLLNALVKDLKAILTEKKISGTKFDDVARATTCELAISKYEAAVAE